MFIKKNLLDSLDMKDTEFFPPKTKAIVLRIVFYMRCMKNFYLWLSNMKISIIKKIK